MTQYSDFFAPEGLRVRGTVVVVPGRGETLATYGRLGRRLAADAYRVRVLNAPALDGDDATVELSTLLEAAVTDTVAEGSAGGEDVVRPLVVVGADSGAAAVAALLGRAGTAATVRPDALVLAGLPGRGAGSAGSWEEELDVRTACPTHRGTLTDDPDVRRGSLGRALPDTVSAAALEVRTDLPVLFLVGDADPLADHESLRRTAESAPRARLSVVHGAHHDVLNDLQHRSVAAELVDFLETVRNGLRPLVTVESSAW
ncbi:alpha-beta hydrolase superfamily lysophospholipase [Streptomyces sp. B3I7]|uniref:alpha/beta hydrolase n=1 Tax=Streptomyces sp. B3I7 TaxID=3042269 RepID=UPI002788EC0F|nr:alpha/beta hydrolase [Streptomyces sp. B3I7]MDQ0815332.1 alpha-beta hydrolase superfamily lysophospholipase [Streptomyces sp. B3I7]